MKEREADIREYDDIINLPRPVSARRPHMSAADRAAQFSPFAALSGYDVAIRETARLTDERVEPDDDSLAALNERYQTLMDALSESPEVTITYFQADEKKSGGAYVTVTGVVKNVDEYEREIRLRDGKRIPMGDIYELNGELFEKRRGGEYML